MPNNLKIFGLDHFKQCMQSKETVSASALPAIQRAKESGGVHFGAYIVSTILRETAAKNPTGKMSFHARLFEADAPSGSTPVEGKVPRGILIQEGLGNLRDLFYYTQDALKSAVPVFAGAQFYADHPDQIEEQTRPERSVRDLAGYFNNVHVELGQDGRMMLCGDPKVIDGDSYDWVRDQLTEAVAYSKQYPDKEFVGLSINAEGEASPEEVDLETFLQGGIMPIPDSCKPKLLEALAAGVQTIKLCRAINSAFSCDLVTRAGAGGKLREQEINMTEAERKVAEEAARKKKESEGKKEGDDGKDNGGAGDGGSKDSPEGSGDDAADKDRELVQKMLSQYLGDGHSEETIKLAHEAYQSAKDMGMDEAEAMKCAGYSMKLAKHMASKHQQDPAKNGNGDVAQNPPQPDPKAAPAGPAATEAEKIEKEKKESEAKIISLTAENTKLREAQKKADVEKFLDKTLRESGLSMAYTKRFRDVVKDPKSEKEITEKFTLFKEALSVSGEADGLGFVLGAEKADAGGGTGSKSFADCVEE